MEYERAIVEGAGASGLAALLAGLLPELKGKRYSGKTVLACIQGISLLFEKQEMLFKDLC